MNYTFLDAAPLNGTSFYRLKQTDLNGKSTYSIIRTISLEVKKAISLNSYPNPFTSAFELEVNSDIQSEVQVIVYDLFGKSVYQSSVVLQEGLNQISIDAQNLFNGVYFVQVAGNDMKEVLRIQKSASR
jgi:hypothetical protein